MTPAYHDSLTNLYLSDAAEVLASLSYDTFLASKSRMPTEAGVAGQLEAVNAKLFPFQRSLVLWALRKGRAALFCDTGLGKTFMQLEWARLLGNRTLILAPLAVAQQTIREGHKLGIPVDYALRQADVKGLITITNYERLENFAPSEFEAVALDESSILKSFDGKTRTALIEVFRGTPYRLCCTATPAPNDLEEFGNHAEFLGVSTRRDMLATFFTHKDDGWHIKGYAVDAFYRWLASWAMMVKRPSDIGFDDAGYDLPRLDVTPEWTKGYDSNVAQASGKLFFLGLDGIQGRSAVRRATIADKVQRAASIINASTEQWLVWCGMNQEADNLASAVMDSVNVQGSDSLEHKVSALESFAAGMLRVLITKPKIAGFGMNFQNCHNILFIGLSDSYETYYQAIRRCWRFGQEQPVQVRVILSTMEAPVLENVLRKERQAEEASRHMIEAIAGYERAELSSADTARPYEEGEASGEGWQMLMGDCVERMRDLRPNSVDFSVFSPPFLSLYSYSASERDLGNSKSDAEFFTHFSFLIQGLLRVVKSGRNVAVHVAQVPTTLVDHGVIGLKDFRGETIRAFVAGGFVYHGEVCIDKDPQAQAIRTHSKALLFSQLKKDSSWLRPAMADYILVFRKPGENAVQIQPNLTNNQWIEWARPIWYGIRESDTLNVAEARSEKDERHIAPLQLGTIERCIRLWSNPGELVLSPFAGIGSEGYEAVLRGRRYIGIELKREYYEVARRNLERAVLQTKQGKLL